MTKSSESVFETVQRDVLPDQVIEQILQLIADKRLKPGDKLPPERELANTMQIGRQTLRAALRALDAIDVLDIRQGSGAYVTELSPNKLIERLKFFITLNETSVSEFFEARTAIELSVVGLAAQRISEEELVQLETSPALQITTNLYRFVQDDLEFHKAIALAAGNSILEEFLNVFRAIRGNIRRDAQSILPTAVDTVVNEHRLIVAALRRRDSDGARQAMASHMKSSEIFLRQTILQQGVGLGS